MARLIIIQGTPCSGKTTWARTQVAGKTNHVIVSPDEIRHALGDYWIPKREPLVARAEDSLLDLALRMDYVVFSDATNFDEKRVAHLRELKASANGRIGIMPGGGVTWQNVEAVCRCLGVNEAHGTRIVQAKGILPIV